MVIRERGVWYVIEEVATNPILEANVEEAKTINDEDS